MPNIQEISLLLFRTLVPLLFLFLQYLLYKKAKRWLRGSYPAARWLRNIVAILFAIFNIGFLLVVITRPRAVDHGLLHITAYPFFVWFAATVAVAFFLGIGWLIKAPFKACLWAARVLPSVDKKVANIVSSPAVQTFNTSRRRFLGRGLAGLTAASFAGSTYGVLYGRSTYETTKAEFTLPHLPHELDGFTIGLMSDIHSSVFMPKEEMVRYVAAMNALKADMIVVTGDFVNSMVEEVYPFAEAFSGLQAAHGVYGVLGNHDFFTRNVDLVSREIDDCGLRLLRNEKVIISKNGASMTLLGIDDVRTGIQAAGKIAVALEGRNAQLPTVLLCHRPYFLAEAASHGIDLILSGHTHGGQISLGRFGNSVLAPAALASRYVWGTYHSGNTHMYVSRGIGTVGVPIRINCPPELTLITLRTGQSSCA